MTSVALVHDYLTQRGGAERVVLSLARVFPDAPLYTSVYEPATTFSGFADLDVRPMPRLQRIGPLRRHHRLGLPAYAVAFARTVIEADVIVCSSSGWAHAVRTSGRKVVYCHNPPRWLWQPDDYFAGLPPVARRAATAAVAPLRGRDIEAARSADRYVVNSTSVAERVRAAYGIDAEVVHPPHGVSPGPEDPVAGIEPGHLLLVGRLLPYKHVDAAIEAVRARPELRLVVVGEGPDCERLQRDLPANVTLLGTVTDAELRGLYATCAALLALSHEDFGLTPVEAAAFGRPTVALRRGGYLDTVVEGVTGVLVDDLAPATVAAGIDVARARSWDRAAIVAHAARFDESVFAAAIRLAVEA